MREQAFWIGGYAPAGSNSLFDARLDPEEGVLTVRPLTDVVENPSWVLQHPNGNVLYTVEERVPDGGLAVFRREGDAWQLSEQLPAGGAPCHLTLDETASFLFVSNYMGSLDVWRLDEDAMPVERTATIRHEGHGPNPHRQEGPHIHAALVRGNLVHVTDLGQDQVFVYQLDAEKGSLSLVRRIDFPAGCGPRHMAVHPDHPGLLYVDAELGGGVYVVDVAEGRILQETRAVPDSFPDDFRVSAIRFAGDTLYVSSRECNVITLFDKLPDGTLGEPVINAHQQETPRDVWMDERWCITADEGSQGLTLLRREGKKVTQAAFVPTAGFKPTCVVPVID